jgi:hypothetical protein
VSDYFFENFIGFVKNLESDRVRAYAFAFAKHEKSIHVKGPEKEIEYGVLKGLVKVYQHIAAKDQVKFVENSFVQQTVLKI